MSKKKQQTIAKRNRERAVEEKRRLKRERKQAEREAARNGEPSPFASERVDDEQVPGDGETGEPVAAPSDGV
jgi:hypothetical protein